MVDGIGDKRALVLFKKGLMDEDIAVAVVVRQTMQVALENIDVYVVVQFFLVDDDQARPAIFHESLIALQSVDVS